MAAAESQARGPGLGVCGVWCVGGGGRLQCHWPAVPIHAFDVGAHRGRGKEVRHGVVAQVVRGLPKFQEILERVLRHTEGAG